LYEKRGKRENTCVALFCSSKGGGKKKERTNTFPLPR